MATSTEIRYAPMKAGDPGGIPAPRFREAEQHVLETAFGLLTSSPSMQYMMSFIVRMRYFPETESCQVIIQPHYSSADEDDEEIRTDIISPLSDRIRTTVTKLISGEACGYIAASSSLDDDNLVDLFVLYLFLEELKGTGPQGADVSGVYQMNPSVSTLLPEMKDLARQCMESCLSVIRKG